MEHKITPWFFMGVLCLALVSPFSFKELLNGSGKVTSIEPTISLSTSLDGGLGEVLSASPRSEQQPLRSKYTNEEIAYFWEIAWGSEYGTSEEVIHKWVTDITIKVHGAPTSADLETLEQVITELDNMLEGINLSIVVSNPNMEIYFAPESQFSTINPNYTPTNYGFFSVWWNNQGEIYRSTVLIASEGITQQERTHLIREEVTQSLGPMQDSYRYSDSIFYQGWTATTEYTSIDKNVIRLLYEPQILPGMTQSQLNAILVNSSPALSSGSVSPSSGTITTTFTYNATYTDADNNAPSYVKVYIDNTAYSMAKVSGTYTGGAIYSYSTTLSAGSYTYHFEASDGIDTARLPTGDTSSGPTVTLFEAAFTFTKPDGSALTNTTIYYGTSHGQETNVLGTTNSQGRITSTNSALAGQTIYFKSSDGKYTGNANVGSSGGDISTTLAEVGTAPLAGFPIWVIAIVIIILAAVVGLVLLLKKR